MSLKKLETLVHARDCAKTSMPAWAVPKTKFTDKTASGLATCVTTFIELQGGFSTRMSVEGRVIIDGMGNVKRIPSSNLKGSADTTGCFLSVRLEVEIKINKDTQKENQIKFCDRIKNADGFYLIVRSFEQFVELWERFIKYLPEHFEKMRLRSIQYIKKWEGLCGS